MASNGIVSRSCEVPRIVSEPVYYAALRKCVIAF